MAKKLVSELSRLELDYWVAMAEGKYAYFENDRCFTAFIDGNIKYYYVYSPSTNPAQGWPIIEREKICLNYDFYKCDHKEWMADVPDMNSKMFVGETSLIAAMRFYIGSVYGETVGDDNE